MQPEVVNKVKVTHQGQSKNPTLYTFYLFYHINPLHVAIGH